MHPLFSIITVTFNAADTLPRTLHSVAEQSCGLYEHIIMDGASTDQTMEIAQHAAEYDNRVIAVSKPDKGIYDAMNNAMAIAQGDYLIFLNSGDKFHSPEVLQMLADAILANDYPGIVYGQTDLVDNDGRYLGPRHLVAPPTLTLKSFKRGMVVCHQAMAVLKRIAPYYRLKYKHSADYEWAILCLQHSRSNVYVPEVLIDYLAEGHTTKHHAASLKERFSIMRTYYGLLPTLWRHIGFGFRYALRRRKAVNKQ